MARYIDLDTAIENIRNGDGTPTQKLFAECCLLGIPAADVAPRSEVEKLSNRVMMLNEICESYALQYGTAIDKEIILKTAKSDVAREIFEEIEQKIKLVLEINSKEKDELLYKGFFNCEMLSALNNQSAVLRAIADFIAELKKKHTENKQTNKNK